MLGVYFFFNRRSAVAVAHNADTQNHILGFLIAENECKR